MHKEIGGYLELDTYNLTMLHKDGIMLNCGRSALAYIIESNNIKTIWIPYYICDSIIQICKKYNVEINRYRIDISLNPILDEIDVHQWLYIVNYYGQLSNDFLNNLSKKFNNLIIDNAQSYFSAPINNANTLYTCRKFFGVSDGAILYTKNRIKRKLKTDISYERMIFVLGRYECNAEKFYNIASDNNDLFSNYDIMNMSKLTRNLLCGINYDQVKHRRTENFKCLSNELNDINILNLKSVEGAYMYPFFTNKANIIKEKLLKQKIYIPVLWPNVLDEMEENTLEYKLASNVLPLPVDQRYNLNDMNRIIKIIKENI